MTPPSVSEEMVAAAWLAYQECGWSTPECMNAALTAALAHLPAGSEAVKPVAMVERTPSRDVMASVMLQHGTTEQQTEALAYVHGKLPAAPPSTLPAAKVQSYGGTDD